MLSASTIFATATAVPPGVDLLVTSAGMVDVDISAVIQLAMFLALVFTLPRLIFRPMLARIEQRTARTAGARAEAKAMKREAEEQVVVYEKATATQKQKALAARARARVEAQGEANQLVARVKKDTNFKITQGIANLVAAEAKARVEIEKEAETVATMIADKIVEG